MMRDPELSTDVYAADPRWDRCACGRGVDYIRHLMVATAADDDLKTGACMVQRQRAAVETEHLLQLI